MAYEAEMFMTLFGAIGAGLGVAVYFIWTKIVIPKKWPIDVIIYEKRDNGYNVVSDMARAVIDKQGRTFMRLKKAGRWIRPVKFEDIQIVKGGKRSMMQLYSPGRDEFFPTQFYKTTLTESDIAIMEKTCAGVATEISMKPEDFDKGALKTIADDMKFWWVNEQRAALENWKKGESWLVKYAPYFSVIVAGALILIMLVMVTDGMNKIAATNTQVASQLANVVDKLSGSVAKMDTTAPVSPSILPGLPAPPA